MNQMPTYLRASYGARRDGLRATYRPSPETAPRNRRHRAGSWRDAAERLAEWITSDLPKLDLPVIQIDGLLGRQQASARPNRGGDRERNRRAGARRQSDRARA